MEETKLERLEYTLFLFCLGLIPIHLYLSVLNFFHGIDKGYGHSFPVRSYVLIGVYLLVILSANLFMLRFRTFALSRELRKYWGSACVAVVIVMLFYSVLPNHGDMIAVLCLLYTPFLVLAPLLELLGMPLYGEASQFSIAVVGVFCLFNWAVCKFLVREEQEETA